MVDHGLQPRLRNESASSSTPSSPGPLLDDENDFFEQRNESQSSLGVASSEASSIHLAIRLRPKRPIESIPSEILICILAKLASSQDLYHCLLVSKGWAHCCVDLLWHRPLFTTWKRLQNVVASIQSKHAYWPYGDLIKRLNLSSLSDKINDGTLEPFMRCKRIERLTLTNCSKISDQGIMALVDGNRNLLALDITGINSITDQTIRTLASNCRRLQGLNITNCSKVTDEALVILAQNCKYLKRLKLNWVFEASDESIQTFANHCPHMLEIDLQGCGRITDTAVTSLILAGRQLRELRLALCHEVTDGAFLQIPPGVSFDTLRILDLTACLLLTDAAVERIIDGAPRLRILVLGKCHSITDRSILAVTKLGKNLHDIHLSRCTNVTDDALRELIKHCNRIRYIDLAGCTRVTDASVKQLSTLPKLRRIGLVKCQLITDQSITTMAMAMTRSAAEPNSRGQSRPMQTSNLERVHLSYCVNVSLQGVHALLNMCPKLTHLSLTGIEAFHSRDDLISFCRDAPSEFTEEQRRVFCVFSGDGVARLRQFLNHEVEARTQVEPRIVTFDDDMIDDDGMTGLMQNTGLEEDDDLEL